MITLLDSNLFTAELMKDILVLHSHNLAPWKAIRDKKRFLRQYLE